MLIFSRSDDIVAWRIWRWSLERVGERRYFSKVQYHRLGPPKQPFSSIHLYCLEINCNSESCPGLSWRLATLPGGQDASIYIRLGQPRGLTFLRSSPEGPYMSNSPLAISRYTSVSFFLPYMFGTASWLQASSFYSPLPALQMKIVCILGQLWNIFPKRYRGEC